MRKSVWYLVHDLTSGTQQRFHSQKRLIGHLRHLGCCFDNNALPQILLEAHGKQEHENEDIGELCLISEDDHDICVEELP